MTDSILTVFENGVKGVMKYATRTITDHYIWDFVKDAMVEGKAPVSTYGGLRDYLTDVLMKAGLDSLTAIDVVEMGLNTALYVAAGELDIDVEDSDEPIWIFKKIMDSHVNERKTL